MTLEEQRALLELWSQYLADHGRRPTAAAMREVYVDVVAHSRHYRYGMAPVLFDLIIHGVFDEAQSALWSSARSAASDHRAA
jgi:hypothetical protein